MEYTVGSLAELISGNKSDNQTKVVEIPFKMITKNDEDSVKIGKKALRPKNQSEETVDANVSSSKRKKHKIVSDVPKRTIKSLKDKNPQVSKNESRTLPKFRGNIPESNKTFLGRKRKVDQKETDVSDNAEDSFKKPKLVTNEMSAANRIKNKFNQEIKNSNEYKDKTLFVGNLPIAVSKDKVKKHFKKYGAIDSIRIRGIAVADIKTSKKVAALKKEFHPDRNSVCAFIRFKDSEDAKKAEAENGVLFHDHHLRVQFCESDAKPDESKAIFIGNLPFTAEDEELWELFKICGPISHVRIVRDGRTGIGKGFGYVNFKDSDSVQFALERETFSLKDRQLRVSLCEANRAKKQSKKKLRSRPGKPNSKEQQNDDKQLAEPKVKGDGNTANGETFAGTKFNDMKKKKKFGKGGRSSLEKKNLAKQLTVSKIQRNLDV